MPRLASLATNWGSKKLLTAIWRSQKTFKEGGGGTVTWAWPLQILPWVSCVPLCFLNLFWRVNAVLASSVIIFQTRHKNPLSLRIISSYPACPAGRPTGSWRAWRGAAWTGCCRTAVHIHPTPRVTTSYDFEEFRLRFSVADPVRADFWWGSSFY